MGAGREGKQLGRREDKIRAAKRQEGGIEKKILGGVRLEEKERCGCYYEGSRDKKV